MGEIQRAMNTLVASLSGAAAAGSKLGKKLKKPEAKQPQTEVGSSMGFTTELSSDEAAKRAFSAATNKINEKFRAKNLRDAKTGRYVRLYKAQEGSK